MGWEGLIIQCHNEGGDVSWYEKIREWERTYLEDARKRLQKQMDGYELSVRDVANMVSYTAPHTVEKDNS